MTYRKKRSVGTSEAETDIRQKRGKKGQTGDRNTHQKGLQTADVDTAPDF